MPLETLPTLQDLEITGNAGAQQHEAQYEPVETDEQPAQRFHPSAGPGQASRAHSIEQPHTSPFYPPPLNPFGFDGNSAIPIDPGLLDAQLGHPAAPGPGGGGTGFHQSPWTAQPPNTLNMDSYMVSPTSLPQYNSSVPLVPGMSSFEPMVSTAWSMDGSMTSTSASRGPTMSSSMSVRGTSTPASSQSPSSPRKVSTGMLGPPAASNDASPIHLGMQTEPRAEVQPSKKRRQASGPKAPPKTIADKRSHRTNSAPGLTTPPVPIAPATSAVATTVDDSRKNNNKKKGSSSSSSSTPNRQQTTPTATTTTTTTTTTITAPSGPTQLGSSSSSSQPTGPPAQQAQPAQPDPRARNREAANRCRAKSKVAVAELEATERAMGAEHQSLTLTARSLRNEVLALKNQLLMHGNCGDDLIQQYLTNSARLVGSGVLGPVAAGAAGMPMVPVVRPPVPQLVVPPGAGGGGVVGSSSSPAMLSASPPGVLPSSSAPVTGLAAARGHKKGGGGRKQ